MLVVLLNQAGLLEDCEELAVWVAWVGVVALWSSAELAQFVIFPFIIHFAKMLRDESCYPLTADVELHLHMLIFTIVFSLLLHPQGPRMKYTPFFLLQLSRQPLTL